MNLNFIFLPPAVAFILFGIQWLLWGRDPRGGKDTITVNTDPPENLSVIEAGVLYDDILNTEDISLELLDMYFKSIIDFQENGTISLKVDQSSPEYQNLETGQKLIINTLFQGMTRKSMYVNYAGYEKNSLPGEATPNETTKILFKMYQQRMAGKIDDLKLAIYDLLTQKGYFTGSPFEQRKPYFAIAGLLLAGPLMFNIAVIMDNNTKAPLIIPWSLICGLILAAIIIAFIASAMGKKTIKGVEAKAYILGFRQYIQTAELDRIKFILENDINAYKNILPYAGLFNAFDKWILPLKTMEQGLLAAEAFKIKDSITALDVESSITKRKTWARAFLNLFFYGLKLLPRKKHHDWDDG